MITMRLHGGMGNQMFEYALGLALAKLNNTSLRLDLSTYPDHAGRDYDLTGFPVDATLVKLPANTPYTKEKDFTFDPEVLAMRGDIFLDGYWQSEKYFLAYEELVRQSLTFTQPAKNQGLFKHMSSSPSVAVSIRRGDYATNPHTTWWHGLTPLSYYRKAYELIKQREPKAQFFIFTDEPDWEGLRDFEGEVVRGDSHEHLKLMSSCKHLILSNSTFAWWGAWLSRRGGTKIVPKKWFAAAPLDTKDLFPASWIKLDGGEETEPIVKTQIKPFVAVHSCVKFANNGVHQAIRDTWGKTCPWPVFFFIGKPGKVPVEGMTPSFIQDCKKWNFLGGDNPKLRVWDSPEVLDHEPLPDEIVVDCYDAYITIPWKKKEITKFQLKHGYTHCLQLVGDSYVQDWGKVMDSGFEQYKYCGVHAEDKVCCYGATGYWLEAEAAKLLLDEPVEFWSEDYWVGVIMTKNGMPPVMLAKQGNGIIELSPSGHGGGLDPKLIHDHCKKVSPHLLDGTSKETLLAIITCNDPKYASRLNAQKSTWIPMAKLAGYDVKIFTGPDLGVPDDYLSLPLKTKALCQWALAHGYKRAAKIDDDCYVNMNNFEVIKTDYAGLRCRPHDAGCKERGVPDFPKGTIKFEYASGGAYWLSERSMKLLTEAPIGKEWAEDRWVGQVLGEAGISLMQLPKYEAWTINGFRFNKSAIILAQLPNEGAILEAHEVLINGKTPDPFYSKLSKAINRSHTPVVKVPSVTIPDSIEKKVNQVMTPIAIPAAWGGVSQDWRGTLLGAKVARAIARGFKVAAVCPLGSSYHKQLSKVIPKHIEEIVETPEGKRVLFLVH
jgi:hypothetical protein